MSKVILAVFVDGKLVELEAERVLLDAQEVVGKDLRRTIASYSLTVSKEGALCVHTE